MLHPCYSRLPSDSNGRLSLVRVRLNGGGYDRRGLYWGTGAPLYLASDRDGNEQYLRAATRDAAKASFPGRSFFR